MARKKWQLENMCRLVAICNQLGGGVYDGTAIGSEKLEKFRKAHVNVEKVIYYTFFEEEKESSERELRKLEILTAWNFPDRYGRLSDEERKINARLQKELDAIQEEE